MPAPKGHKRWGGRKTGSSKITQIKRSFHTYFTEQEVKDLVLLLKKQAPQSLDALKYALDQLFDRPAQRMQISGHEGEAIKIDINVKREIDKVYGPGDTTRFNK